MWRAQIQGPDPTYHDHEDLISEALRGKLYNNYPASARLDTNVTARWAAGSASRTARCARSIEFYSIFWRRRSRDISLSQCGSLAFAGGREKKQPVNAVISRPAG